jgi:uncharacterized protein YdhG (YjbR/CyaY superfamily)
LLQTFDFNIPTTLKKASMLTSLIESAIVLLNESSWLLIQITATTRISNRLLKKRFMMPPKKGFKTIDEYIAYFPKNVQPTLQQVISYSMPAFKQNHILVWFASFRNHIGFYPKVSAMEAFKEKLSNYQTSKGTIRFPSNKPIPIELVKEIVKFRVKEDQIEK